jgi:hypothetical protein
MQIIQTIGLDGLSDANEGAVYTNLRLKLIQLLMIILLLEYSWDYIGAI